MSDPQTTTPTPPAGEPNVQAGQQGGAVPNTQQGQPPAAIPPVTTPAAAAQQPYRVFADQKELDGFVQGAKTQAERAAIRKLAKDLGFQDADEMRDTLAALRQAQGGSPAQPTTPDAPAAATTATAPSDNTGARLSMALKVGSELNLPVALVSRLQGDTEEAMKADAEALVALMGSGTINRGPGIPPVPAGSQPVTFTTTQLQDAEFVRNNAAAIQQAAREGRIVKS